MSPHESGSIEQCMENIYPLIRERDKELLENLTQMHSRMLADPNSIGDKTIPKYWFELVEMFINFTDKQDKSKPETNGMNLF